ncbi:MAG: glycoside hydrolase [Chromatiales bacterium]
MAADERLKVVLCWHMHQPWYWDPQSERYELPWVYLHAIKDYADMAAHLEAVPTARAVVNFTPTLLEQLVDYERRITASLAHDTEIRDRLLDALRLPALPPAAAERAALLRACLQANEQNLIQRFPPYARLAELARCCVQSPERAVYVNDQFLADLLVWYHLAWLGETVRQDARVQRLTARAAGYTYEDRIELLTIIGELIAGLIPRYQRLAAGGRVELSVTPYAHPIAPLLIDFTVAREAMPEIALPTDAGYPGGVERARWHIDKAVVVFRHVFGFQPRGIWPAEGGISAPLLKLLDEFGFRWTASGQGVIGHTLSRGGGVALKQQPYRVNGTDAACFFRDDGLSDRIGFAYANWHADDAVSDFIGHLHSVKRLNEHSGNAVVPIIMDGENAWDHYPRNGWYFLNALYRRLSEDPQLELTTFSACIEQGMPVEELSQLVAGSWIYGNFSTWIGETDKNRAWDLLVAAKRAVDAALAEGGWQESDRRQVEQQLAICEGSDWFWWFGPAHARETVAEFDRLFRHQLVKLYRLVRAPPPAELMTPVSLGGAGSGIVGGGTMLPAQR